MGAELERLAAMYDQHGVRGGDRLPLTPETVGAFDEVVAATNGIMEQVRLIGAYLNARLATDARHDEAARVLSQVQAQQAGLQKLTIIEARIDDFERLAAAAGDGA